MKVLKKEMRMKKGLALMVMVALILGLALSAGAMDSELRVKLGVLSHKDYLFGNPGLIMGGDCLFYLKDSPLGIAGGLEYISSARTTSYSDIAWRDVATILSFLYFPTIVRGVYLGVGLEYHWMTEEVTHLYKDWRSIRRESGLGLHLVAGFNLGEYIFLEGKISSVEIDIMNKGGISLQIGAKF